MFLTACPGTGLWKRLGEEGSELSDEASNKLSRVQSILLTKDQVTLECRAQSWSHSYETFTLMVFQVGATRGC